jgi:gliding motility-associated lipoprotein GldH
MNLKNSMFLILFGTLLISCHKKQVFDDYWTLGNQWHKDSVAQFNFEQKDTISSYNLFLNIRNNKNYPFSNLFLIVSLEQPDGFTLVDTLEYQMAYPNGALMGKGFIDLKENKLFYKEGVRFPKIGNYKVSIAHAMRHTGKISGIENLEGITDVGFSIESTEKK